MHESFQLFDLFHIAEYNSMHVPRITKLAKFVPHESTKNQEKEVKDHSLIPNIRRIFKILALPKKNHIF